jgi:cardiolipin synthase
MLSHKTLDSITLIMMVLVSLLLTASAVQLVVGVPVPYFLSNFTVQLVNFIFGITIVLMIIILVLENDNPVRTMAWLLVLLFLPVVGFFFYLWFGRNWRKTRLFNRKGLADAINLAELWPQPARSCLPDDPEDLPHKLTRLLESNSKAILTCHNNVSIIPDTNTALDMICAEIETARQHVHLEYFSLAADASGRRVKELLERKARAGVEVRFIYDDVGCWNLGPRFKRQLRAAGVRFVPFMPVWLPFFNSRANYRNHRKLVIVDGRCGYLGGLNIGDKYFGKSRYFGYWRDSVVRVEGESAITLQAIFLTDWFFVSKQNLLTAKEFAKYTPPAGGLPVWEKPTLVQIAASGPDTDHASILQAYFMAISNASKHICIASPYLILNESLLMALKTASLSGVKVQIVLPGKPDHLIVWFGSKSYYQELLDTGVEIYEYQNGFLHSKVLIVDGCVLSIGTANMDLRSFNHNFEVTAMVYDEDICAEALSQFETDLKQSRLVDPLKHAHRSIFRKSLESLCRLFSPLL